MLSTFVSHVTGLFDKRFLFRVWFPTFLFGAVAVLVAALAGDLQASVKIWSELPPLVQAWLSTGGLVVVTFVAYICDGLMDGIVRLYEGYWPDWAGIGRQICLGVQRHRWQYLSDRMDSLESTASFQEDAASRAEYDRLYTKFYHGFPWTESLLMPTRLGNVLRAAEEYSTFAYSLDAPTVWPRLVQYLPDGFQARLSQASLPLTAMLFSATLSFLFAVAGGMALFFASDKWWLFLCVVGGGLGIFVWCYEGAVQRAVEYGVLIRTAFDLYRNELLKALGVPLPLSPRQEREVWGKLTKWWYQLEVPGVYEEEKTWHGIGKPQESRRPEFTEHVVYLRLGTPPREEKK